MPVSDLFWNAPSRVSSERANDPLGFDALREAMADVLVPFLTGATRSVRDFTAAALGLYWALEHQENSRHPDAATTDREIWAYFEPFERAIKHYWFRQLDYSEFLGKRRVREAAAKGPQRPIDLNVPILVNQRAIGLLPSHLRSLRSIGLVELRSLRVVKTFFHSHYLVPPPSRFDPEATRVTVAQLDKNFGVLPLLEHRGRTELGHLLFGPFVDSKDETRTRTERRRMERSARAARRRWETARSWPDVAPILEREERADPEQARVASAVQAVVRFEGLARVVFGQLLGGASSVSQRDRLQLKQFAKSFLRVRPFPATWDQTSAARAALETAARRIQDGEAAEHALIELHADTMKLRKREPWLVGPGQEVAVEFRHLPRQTQDPDLRFGNLRSLIHETRWTGA